MKYINYYRVEYEDRDEGYIELFDTIEEAKEYYDEIVESTRYNHISEVKLYAGDELIEEYYVGE